MFQDVYISWIHLKLIKSHNQGFHQSRTAGDVSGFGYEAVQGFKNVHVFHLIVSAV